MVRKLILLSFILCTAACTAKTASTPLPTPSTGQIETEEQAVYAFLLSNLYQHREYVIMDTTSTGVTGVENTSPDSRLRSAEYAQRGLRNSA